MRLKTRRHVRRIQEGLELLWESDERRIRRKYRRAFGRDPDLDHPQTFNEKILWLNLHDRRSERTLCADKYSVRDWVRRRIGEQYLVPLLGVYDRAENLDLDRLPDSFVVKAAHGSGSYLIVRDKGQLDWNRARRTFNDWLSRSYYPQFRERQYREIPHRLVVEELLLDAHGAIPTDYKLLCLSGGGGRTILVEVDLDRETVHRRHMYDLDWNRLPFELTYPGSGESVPRPGRLDEMVELATRLSDGFPFVRVDLYSTPRGLFFGELTFTPDAGMGRFQPPEWDRRLGDLIELPERSSP